MNQRGFTLVEIIIALTILSMLFIVISYIQARGAASYAATAIERILCNPALCSSRGRKFVL
jgi:prepilin-type N-terminal cleavage/methylation domain-containing protein